MSRIALLAAGLVATFALAGPIGASSNVTKLTGTVGPGFTITLKKGTAKVKTLKAGTYKVVISDKSAIHGWSLDGPHGFAKDISPVPFTGSKTVTLKLKAGAYKFYCPSHESTMFGHFKVT